MPENINSAFHSFTPEELWGPVTLHHSSEVTAPLRNQIIPGVGAQAVEESLQQVPSYDHLFIVEDLPMQNKLVAETEAERDPYLQKIFAPIKTIVEAQSELPKVSYNYLMEKDEKEYQRKLNEHIHQSRHLQEEQARYTVVTPETRIEASARLQAAQAKDPHIRQIIQKYQRLTEDKSPKYLVDLVRTNVDLRYELGSYLLNNKMTSRLHKMPERIIGNTEKNPNHRGYRHMGRIRSQEYATLLALSMLDGTFKTPGKGDEIERNNLGIAQLGQHRAAAEELLS